MTRMGGKKKIWGIKKGKREQGERGEIREGEGEGSEDWKRGEKEKEIKKRKE